MNQSSAPKKLPDKLIVLVDEIEAKAGRPICWKQDEGLPAEMGANLVGGNPTISYRNFSESGAAHELLHLKLALSGFPRLICPEIMDPTMQAMIMLEGVVQHSVIFPKLRQLGYDDDERRAIRKQLNLVQLEGLDRIANEPDLRAMFSMLYVRTLTDCEDLSLHAKLQRLFSDERLQICRVLGEKVIEVIRSRDLSKNQEAHAVLEEAIAVLELSDTITFEYP